MGRIEKRVDTFEGQFKKMKIFFSILCNLKNGWYKEKRGCFFSFEGSTFFFCFASKGPSRANVGNTYKKDF